MIEPSRKLTFTVDGKTHEHLLRAAYVRKISISRLMQRLAYHICRSDLVLVVLDDDSRGAPVPGERRQRRQPKDHLFDCVRH